MPETINLIPKEERVQQTKTKVVKMSTVLSIVLLIIVGAIGGYFFYRASTLKNDIESLDSDISDLRAQITSLSEIEITARNLFQKSNILKSIFEKRIYYSQVLSALTDSTPEAVDVTSFSLGREDTLAISGRADDYNDVQDFMNRVLERDLFSNVELNSVSLENRGDTVSFLVMISYNKDLLHE